MRDFEKEAGAALPCAYACSGVQLGRECHPECPKRALVPAVASALRAAEAAGFARGRDAAAEVADRRHTLEEMLGSPTGSLTALDLSRAIRALRPDAVQP